MTVRSASPALHGALLCVTVAIVAWSGFHPAERPTWFLETAPVYMAAIAIGIAYPRWRFTPLVLTAIAVHCAILCVGGKYTYAEVPAFNWLRDEFHLARNYYDRIGHLAQGFIPALAAREILLRRGALAKRGPWLFLFVTSICLAFSAFYEFIEWWAALLLGQGADAFLGTQGDPWDTQWDMFCAFAGAVLAQALLGRLHDRQLGPDPTASGKPGNS